MMKWIVPHEAAGTRLDCFLAQATDQSRSAIQKLIKSCDILVNNLATKPSASLIAGDEVVCLQDDYLFPPNAAILKPEPIHLDIVFEDEWLIILNKPVGLVVHPAPGHNSGTLMNSLLFHYPALAEQNMINRFGIVHRLDQFTEGLMVIAKESSVYIALQSQFKNREVQKKYYAIVHGQFKPDERLIDYAIGRHPKSRTKYAAFPINTPNTKPAMTMVTIIKRFTNTSLVDITLMTGRTHQIRVHLAHIGYPVVGDPVYTPKKWRGTAQLLQAYYLGFIHPKTQQLISVKLPLSPRFNLAEIN